jgi:sugar O-acyltransferase (sialic acid O-acetyltransferase NeuD family)
MEDVFVYGAGGHGRSVADALRNASAPFRVSVVVDDNPSLHGKLLGARVIGGPASIGAERGIVAIGDNVARMRIASRFRGRLIALVHRSAFVSETVPIGEGSVVMAGAVVNVGSTIGPGVIVNTGATIDHDCRVDEGAHVAPGCHLCGDVQVGAGALLGVGCVVVPGIRIGRDAFIAAGQVVARDVPAGSRLRLAK